MLESPNISYTVENHLCTGCGICEDVCALGAIRINLMNGVLEPSIDERICINNNGCHKCFNVCPGHSINLLGREKNLFSTGLEKYDYYVGRYINCYSGYSNENEIRYHSASGGLLSQFLIFLLDKGIIQGAVVTGFAEKDKTKPISYIAKTKDDVLLASSSKYCPVALNRVGNEITNSDGKFVIVGLPCHIQAFRKREDFDKRFKDRILGYFSIYCSSTRSYFATEYILKEYNIHKERLTKFAYRDDGCLGFMKAKFVDGKELRIPFLEYYSKIRSFFKPRRCLSCVDHYGLLADICFGDIHIGNYKKDKIGVNSLIVRSTYFDKLLIEAKMQNVISLNKIECSVVNESQADMLYPRYGKVAAIQSIDKLLGRKIATYDVDLKKEKYIKYYYQIMVTLLQIYIGKRKYLWFIVNYPAHRAGHLKH